MPARLPPVFVRSPEDRVGSNFPCKQVLARHSIDCKRLLAIERFFFGLFSDDVYHPLPQALSQKNPHLVFPGVSLVERAIRLGLR